MNTQSDLIALSQSVASKLGICEYQVNDPDYGKGGLILYQDIARCSDLLLAQQQYSIKGDSPNYSHVEIMIWERGCFYSALEKYADHPSASQAFCVAILRALDKKLS